MNAQEVMNFKLTGGYQFANTYKISNKEPFIYAEAGQLTGSFRWEFDDGTSGNTHVNGATANRMVPEGNSLFGTMRINMFELDGSPTDSQLLFLQYTSSEFKLEGSKVIITVVGQFVGGTGKYEGASGSLELTSINGYIGNGAGTLVLKGESQAKELNVRQWVEDYFKSTQSGDPQRWASNFAPGAIVNDPYGTPYPKNEKEIVGRGEQFMSSFKEAGLYPGWIFVDGLTATAKWVGKATTKDGKKAEFHGINVYRWTPGGKIASLTGYWSPEEMVFK